MSLYGQYIKERLGKAIVENELGFATYSFTEQGECYIEDIYVVPEARKDGVASNLADQITVIAKERGCHMLLGSVMPTARGSTSSLKILLAYGFRLRSAGPNYIIMEKEI